MDEAQLTDSPQVAESPLSRLQRLSAERRRSIGRTLGTREARRAGDRSLKRERSKYIREQQVIDGSIIRAKKAWLRRHHGNPTKRQEALIAWFVVENAKRGYE